MRLLLLSWEYPPRVIGGLANHVYELSRALVREGVETTVVTSGGPGLAEREEMAGVRVHRVQPPTLGTPNFPVWALLLNFALLETANRLIYDEGPFDLIHGHDWLVTLAGKTLKHTYHVPLIATVHATEHGRNHGLHDPWQHFINDVEWLLGYEAWRVITVSKYMQEEIFRVFHLPPDKVRVIYNGVDPAAFRLRTADPGFRHLYASPDQKLVFYIGRLVIEKGVQVLLDAIPRIISVYPNVKFVIAGSGPMEDELKRQAYALEIHQQVYFTGYVDEETKARLYRVADVAVFPSLYEPFGIVALEAMAAGVPVVTSNAGGLKEIVEHEKDGLRTVTGSSYYLAEAVLRLLQNPELGAGLAEKARQKVQKGFSWSNIAKSTIQVYKEVLSEYQESPWKTASPHVWPGQSTPPEPGYSRVAGLSGTGEGG
ncbi:MAG: glycosyltransferase family 4 protein [Firmicutes bacterium]|nr:glycosyltransferase family 4 protein [Bacillota bacterium]